MLNVFLIVAFLKIFCHYVQSFSGEDVTSDKTASSPYPYNVQQLRLIRQLANPTNHDPRVRPVTRPGQSMNVTIRMNLYQIVDVNERQQYVLLYCWMTQMWYDPTLSWNPAEYSNISMVVLPYTDIWLPDTYLYNNLAMVREESEHWINTILQMEENSSSAFVIFRYPVLYKFACTMDVRHFPFDQQHCVMVFGSWTYDSTGIDFFPEKENIAMEDFSESEEWTLLSFKVRLVDELTDTAQRSLDQYACCPEPFSLLRLHLKIKRKPLHYIVNLIIPTVIISVISNVGFFTPTSTGHEREEKISLGITTLLAFAILLLMVSDQMPTTSVSIPLIGWFLLGIMIQTSVATLLTAITMSVQMRARTGQRLSRCVRKIFFKVVSPCLSVPPPPALKVKVVSELASDYTVRDAVGANYGNASAIDSATTSTKLIASDDQSFRNGHQQSKNATVSKGVLCKNKMPISKLDQTPSRELIFAEYEWFAAILDRICLILSLGSVITLALAIIFIGQMK